MIEQETNIFKRAFIRVWYNDNFRFLVILIPTHGVVTIPATFMLLHFIGFSTDYLNEAARAVIAAVVLTPIALAIAFNDYTNLNRIGRDTSGRKIIKPRGEVR